VSPAGIDDDETGSLIGVPCAIGAGRLLASQVYGIQASDPLGAATMLLLVSALVAGLIPARRAARVDPMQPLRSE